MPPQIRVLKLAGEAGETAGAITGLHGWNSRIPPGGSVPVSVMRDREYVAHLAAWRGRSVSTQPGEWLGARREQAG